MTTHLVNCRPVPRSIGRLNAAIAHGNDAPPITEQHSLEVSSTKKASAGPLSNILSFTISSDVKRVLHVTIAGAIHRSASQFSLFNDPSWREFLSILRPASRAPRADVICGVLLDSAYEMTMRTTVEKIRMKKGGTIRIDRATYVRFH